MSPMPVSHHEAHEWVYRRFSFVDLWGVTRQFVRRQTSVGDCITKKHQLFLIRGLFGLKLVNFQVAPRACTGGELPWTSLFSPKIWFCELRWTSKFKNAIHGGSLEPQSPVLQEISAARVTCCEGLQRPDCWTVGSNRGEPPLPTFNPIVQSVENNEPTRAKCQLNMLWTEGELRPPEVRDDDPENLGFGLPCPSQNFRGLELWAWTSNQTISIHHRYL